MALCVVTAIGLFATAQDAYGGGISLSSAMGSAANARHVPLPLLEAIAYVNTRWELISQPADDGGYGPMNILPSQLDKAAALSGYTQAQIRTDPVANLDAGAALLAKAHGTGSDLASWQPAATTILGPLVANEVYDALRSGESRTTSSGETITLAPQAVPRTTPAPTPTAATLAPTTAVATSTDYAAAAWVPASTANYSTANRPHDYPVDMIIIHDTEGSYGSAIQEFQNPAAQASAHYVVSDLGQITQMVAEHDIAWHAGNWDYNTRAIGIEHEGFAWTPGWYTTAMYNASAQLAASICSRWGVPMDRQHVIGHSEVPDPNNPGLFGGAGQHTDPGPYWDWGYYMSQAQAYAGAMPSPPRMMPDPTALASDHTAVVTWQPAHSCHAPITGYTVVGQPGNVIQNLPAGATGAAFTGLQNGVYYSFTVTANNSYGQDSLATRPVLTGPMPFGGLYTLDAYGGVHQDSSNPLAVTAYWPNWTIARELKTLPMSSGPPQTGFVLDGYGGLHSFGGPLAETSGAGGHRWGWDIARDFAFLPDASGGIVLDGYGGLHPFRVNGNSTPLQVTPSARWNWDIARKLVIFPDGSGGYVLDGWGGIHGFGINGAVPASVSGVSGSAYWPSWDIAREIALVPGDGGHSGYVLDGYGGLHPFHPTADGSVMPAPLSGARWDWDIVRTMWLSRSSTAASPSGYLLDGYGGVHPLGQVPIPDHPYFVGAAIAVGLAGQ
jgi:N-acetyl-anhydromuramyl-L-alanine amidase AmpD